MFATRKLHMVEIFDLARPVTVVTSQAVARVIQPAILIATPSGVDHHVQIGTIRFVGLRLECEAPGLSLRHNPVKRDVGQRIVRITAADIGMNAGEPDLRQDARRYTFFVPKNRMEGRSLVVERQSVARSLY